MNFKFKNIGEKSNLISIFILIVICISFLINSSKISLTKNTVDTLKNNNIIKNKNNHHNSKIDAIIKEAEEGKLDTSLTGIVFASNDKVILCGDMGLIAYDIYTEKIYRLLDLNSINLTNMNGHYNIVFSAIDNGNKILMYNSLDEKNKYIYDVENDKLEKTNIDSLSNPNFSADNVNSENFEIFEKRYSGLSIDFDCSFYKIDENKICYLNHSNKSKSSKKVSSLQLSILDKNTNTEKVYDVF